MHNSTPYLYPYPLPPKRMWRCTFLVRHTSFPRQMFSSSDETEATWIQSKGRDRTFCPCTDKTKSSIVAIGGKDKPFAIRCWRWRVQVRGSRPPIRLFGSWSLSIADEIFAKEQRTQPIMRFSDMCTSASNHSQQSCLIPDQTTMLPPRRHCHGSLQSNISKS